MTIQSLKIPVISSQKIEYPQVGLAGDFGKKSQKSLPKLNYKILSIQIIDIET